MSDTAMEVTLTRLNRNERRRLGGQPCTLCGLRMYFTEIVQLNVIEDDETTERALTHMQCAVLLKHQREAANSNPVGEVPDESAAEMPESASSDSNGDK